MALSQPQQKSFKSDAVRVLSALNRAGIASTIEWCVPRYGEYNGSGRLKCYWLDIFVHDPRYVSTAIEVEGGGSSSRDNDKRDQYLNTLGIRILHIDNRTSGEQVLIRLNGSFRRQDHV